MSQMECAVNTQCVFKVKSSSRLSRCSKWTFECVVWMLFTLYRTLPHQKEGLHVLMDFMCGNSLSMLIMYCTIQCGLHNAMRVMSCNAHKVRLVVIVPKSYWTQLWQYSLLCPLYKKAHSASIRCNIIIKHWNISGLRGNFSTTVQTHAEMQSKVCSLHAWCARSKGQCCILNLYASQCDALLEIAASS